MIWYMSVQLNSDYVVINRFINQLYSLYTPSGERQTIESLIMFLILYFHIYDGGFHLLTHSIHWALAKATLSLFAVAVCFCGETPIRIIVLRLAGKHESLFFMDFNRSNLYCIDSGSWLWHETLCNEASSPITHCSGDKKHVMLFLFVTWSTYVPHHKTKNGHQFTWIEINMTLFINRHKFFLNFVYINLSKNVSTGKYIFAFFSNKWCHYESIPVVILRGAMH